MSVLRLCHREAPERWELREGSKLLGKFTELATAKVAYRERATERDERRARGQAAAREFAALKAEAELQERERQGEVAARVSARLDELGLEPGELIEALRFLGL